MERTNKILIGVQFDAHFNNAINFNGFHIDIDDFILFLELSFSGHYLDWITWAWFSWENDVFSVLCSYFI